MILQVTRGHNVPSSDAFFVELPEEALEHLGIKRSGENLEVLLDYDEAGNEVLTLSLCYTRGIDD